MFPRSQFPEAVHLASKLQGPARPDQVSASWVLSQETQPLIRMGTPPQYRRRGSDLDIAVVVLSKVDSMAAKAAMTGDVGSTAGRVGERNELEGRKEVEPCTGALNHGRHDQRPAVDLLDLDLEVDRPIAKEGDQRLLAPVQRARLRNWAVKAVLQWEVQSITTKQISEDLGDCIGKGSYLSRWSSKDRSDWRRQTGLPSMARVSLSLWSGRGSRSLIRQAAAW